MKLSDVIGFDAPAPQTKSRRRRTRKHKRAAEVRSGRPWAAVILSVDTATLSGWSIRTAGTQREIGEVDTVRESELQHIVRWAMRAARELGWPLVLVLERPWGGTHAVVESLGAARERWLKVWRDCGQPKSRVVRVHVATWRAVMLGRHWLKAKREHVRAYEKCLAEGFLGEELGHDESAAVLIGMWAERAAVVGQLIGARRRRRR